MGIQKCPETFALKLFRLLLRKKLLYDDQLGFYCGSPNGYVMSIIYASDFLNKIL